MVPLEMSSNGKTLEFFNKKEFMMPDIEEAERLLKQAAERNPGRWVEHSRNVARVARTIAGACGMDADKAYIFGLLHDYGRYEGSTGFRHTIEGYRVLNKLGFSEAARVALTHSFFEGMELDDNYYLDQLDQEEDKIFLEKYAENVRREGFEFDEYDKLIQLADCMALEKGVITLNDRFIDLVIRYDGVSFRHNIIQSWKLKLEFDKKAQRNIYELFKDEIMATMMDVPDGIIDLQKKGEI